MDINESTSISNPIRISQSKRWVIKIGSSLITDNGRGLDCSALDIWVEQLFQLQRVGIDVVLVSSGAVAEGMSRLGWRSRPDEISRLQAAAAIGQMGLMEAYETRFRRHGICAAQVLLTHEDFADKQRFLNIQATLQTLMRLKAVPVINENDTVSTEEIRFGDNDLLAALVANMIAADRLVILTDQKGLFTSDPRHNPDATLINRISVDDARLLEIAGGAGTLGRGGMLSKVKAAKMFALSGGVTTIASGRIDDVLLQIQSGLTAGTELFPGTARLIGHKQWLAGHLITRGVLVLDEQAVEAVESSGESVHSPGVLRVEGDFGRNEMIEIADPNGRRLAKGLSNYSAREMIQILNQRPRSTPASCSELVHYGNIVLDFYNRRI
ncbi:glutamate 5-kinase [Burkholderia ubonensis]|uniref:glutamate 5-kinase n=1 Tax=Burkholderia ubonensis TaxID=101571 RepID=UPI0008416519|nr:glutamate 5-kinase [Burkholderia ubonensis]AOK63662.1 glutamate 5-kinase [Burkholderia ubonensis]